MKKIVLLLVAGALSLFNVSCAPQPVPPPPPIVVKTYSYRGLPSPSTTSPRPTSNYKHSSYTSGSTNYRMYSASPESFRAVTTPN